MGLRSGVLEDEEFGGIHVRILRTATRITARWKKGEVHLTAPPHISLESLMSVIDSFRPALRESRPVAVQRFYHGFVFQAEDWGFKIALDAPRPDCDLISTVQHTVTGPFWTIHVNPRLDLRDEKINVRISKFIDKHAAQIANVRVVPDAMEIAAGLGLKVAEWRVSHGKNLLGRCSSKGTIWLTCRLAYLPGRLRRYTVTHELAHLTHLDHSPQFHALWRKYYGDGFEDCKAQLHSFTWPVC